MVDDVVQIVLVAVLLAIGLVGAFGAAGRVTSDVRVTAYAGFWAGVFLVGVLTVSYGSFRPPLATGLTALPSPVAVVAGVVVGAAVIGLFAALRASRAVGAVFVAQVVIAGTGLVLYVRPDGTGPPEAEVRVRIALLTLGAAIGVCLTFLVPRRILAGYLRWRADRAAVRRDARNLHLMPAHRRYVHVLRTVLRHHRRVLRRQRLDALRRRLHLPGRGTGGTP